MKALTLIVFLLASFHSLASQNLILSTDVDPADHSYIPNTAPNPNYLSFHVWPPLAGTACDEAQMRIWFKSLFSGQVVHDSFWQRAAPMSFGIGSASAQFYVSVPAGAQAGQRYEVSSASSLNYWIPLLGGPIPCFPFTEVLNAGPTEGELGGQ